MSDLETSHNNDDSVSEHPFSEYTTSVDTIIERRGFEVQKFQELPELNEFEYVILTNWDNILGPQLTRCWLQSDFDKDEKLINYVNMHVLTGDIEEATQHTRDRKEPKERKLLFLSEQNIIILAIVFSDKHLMRTRQTAKLYCLSFVLPFKNAQQARNVTNLYSYLALSSGNIKEAIKEAPMLRGMHTATSNIDEMILTLDTTYSNLIKYSIDQVYRPMKYFGLKLDAIEFLKKSYQGVLQCGGYGLIIGKSSDLLILEQVSLMLSFIIPVKDKYSTISPTHNHINFKRHIFLQSLMYEETPEEIFYEFPWAELNANKFPLAVVDVSRQTVQCSATLDRFFRDKHSSFDNGSFVKKYGSFVEKLVSRMTLFKKNAEFIRRLGRLALAEVVCKAEVFVKLYDEFGYKNSIAVKQHMKWSIWDSDIFIAWACKKDHRLKRRLFGEDHTERQLELSQVL